MNKIQQSVWLDATPEAAYDYLTTLKHWCRWYPGTIAMEGQTNLPSAAGEKVTESVRTLGLIGKLHWITVESARPSRFAIETTSVKMPLMRGARLKITYEFDPGRPSVEIQTRLTRTLEYQFTGIACVLDRIYLRAHLRKKAAAALARLQEIVRREACDGCLKDAD